jgi:hypothetical protein
MRRGSLAAAEFHLFAVGREIALDLDHEIGIGGRTRSPTVGPYISA